ncbi:hypothetical protein [Flavicella sediminum]|uniref:hypothetical protein n=1 Tax=Flavicella sediminum TaxID=2585141 RepID=UPI00140E5545|nr:hypothetical protein [Flavicella sediminum]
MSKKFFIYGKLILVNTNKVALHQADVGVNTLIVFRSSFISLLANTKLYTKSY